MRPCSSPASASSTAKYNPIYLFLRIGNRETASGGNGCQGRFPRHAMDQRPARGDGGPPDASPAMHADVLAVAKAICQPGREGSEGGCVRRNMNGWNGEGEEPQSVFRTAMGPSLANSSSAWLRPLRAAKPASRRRPTVHLADDLLRAACARLPGMRTDRLESKKCRSFRARAPTAGALADAGWANPRADPASITGSNLSNSRPECAPVSAMRTG